MRALFIIALLVVGYLIYKLHFKRLLAQGKPGQIKLALIGLGLVFLALAMMGRAPAIFAVIGAAMTQVMRLAPLLVRFAPLLKRYLGPAVGAAGAAGAAAGQSRVRTPTLLMTLEHASGHIDGTVLTGPFEGQTLSALNIAELKSLHEYCAQHDAEALRLLQAYLARERASDWQGPETEQGDSSGHTGQPVSGGPMSHHEALEILGLEQGAGHETIVEAHRRLMTRLHPDKGGSNYLASRVNLAKDLLLKG